MVKRSSKETRYNVWLEAEVYSARELLPGNVRQRVKKLLANLAEQPKPTFSQSIDITGLDVPVGIDIRRIRLEHWRVIYAVQDAERWVWVVVGG
jgi:mRNA-degrading endonuclease RelE of RelBE toxin-antitoxin system